MVKKERFTILDYTPPVWSLSLLFSRRPFILRVPLDSAEAGPQHFPSIRVFSSESVLLIGWPKYWSFSISISLSNAYSGLISSRIDWFDLAVQGTLKSLLQHHNLKASILQCSDILMVQLSYSYMATGKSIALTKLTFVGNVISLILNTLFRFVIAFLPRSKCLLISWLQSLSAMILEHEVPDL